MKPQSIHTVTTTLTVEQLRAIQQVSSMKTKTRRLPRKKTVTHLTASQYRAEFVDKVEHNIQKSCVKWFDLQYPGLLLYAIPNGGKRHIVTAVKLKAEGVRRGIPDLKLAVVTPIYPGLYIETKTPDGSLSDDQILAHAYLRAQGYPVVIVRSLEQFQQTITDYLHGKIL